MRPIATAIAAIRSSAAGCSLRERSESKVLVGTSATASARATCGTSELVRTTTAMRDQEVLPKMCFSRSCLAIAVVSAILDERSNTTTGVVTSSGTTETALR